MFMLVKIPFKSFSKGITMNSKRKQPLHKHAPMIYHILSSTHRITQSKEYTRVYHLPIQKSQSEGLLVSIFFIFKWNFICVGTPILLHIHTFPKMKKKKNKF